MTTTTRTTLLLQLPCIWYDLATKTPFPLPSYHHHHYPPPPPPPTTTITTPTEETWDVSHLQAPPTFKILIMGEKQTGKSALCNRLLGKSFIPDEYKEDSTVNIGIRMFTNLEKVPAGSLEVCMFMVGGGG